MKRHGFTLIELLVVITIVSILTAVALPQYSVYKKKAFDLRAQEDLRNVAIAEEAYFIESEKYLSCRDDECTDLPGITKISKGVTINIQADESVFTGTSTHTHGSGKIFRWDSEQGGLLE